MSVYLAALVVLLAFPFVVTTPYFVHILIVTGIYVIFALSYDLTVGRVGALSLAHPAFFGVGAYTAALLATRLQTVYPAGWRPGLFWLRCWPTRSPSRRSACHITRSALPRSASP